MTYAILALLLLICAMSLYSNLLAVHGLSSIKGIYDLPCVMPCATEPLVSVIIAARNEEAAIGETLRMVLDQVYTNLELIIVNDRSTDRTREIIDRMITEDLAAERRALPKKKVVVKDIDSLPPGWLGKNHACHVGSTLADPTSKYLLFLDADSRLERTVIRRIVRHTDSNDIDLLSVFPSYASAPPLAWKSIFTSFNHILMMVISFSILVDMLKIMRAWQCEDPSKGAAIATGKFNLLGKKVYDAAGGHEAIKLEVIDDAYVAIQVKVHHIRRSHPIKATFVWGVDLVQVDWYRSLAGFCKGTQKHLFAGVGYRVANTSILTVKSGMYYILPQILCVMSIWALLGGATTLGMSRGQLYWMCALSVMYVGMNSVFLKWMSRQTFRLAFEDIWIQLFAGVTALFAHYYALFALWYSTITVMRDGGVRWAGTLYPLQQLIDGRKEMLRRNAVMPDGDMS